MPGRQALVFICCVFLVTIQTRGVAPDVAEGAGSTEEALLQQAGLGTDDPSLIAYLRSRVDTPRVDFASLIRKLGARAFAEREKAERDLIAVGPAAVTPLRHAKDNPDPEITRRIAACLEALRKQASDQPEHDLAAVRLLVRRAPDGAIAALLRFLPAAAAGNTEEEVWFGVNALMVKSGVLAPALLAALNDPAPERRALAACLNGRLGAADQKQLVRKLLDDKDASVRLRAAQGLLAGGDKAGLGALIGLLDQPDVALAWQAEELLVWLSGETAPEATVSAGDPAQRRKCRAAWQAWLGRYGDRADPVEALKQPGRPGLILVPCGSRSQPNPGVVFLFGCLGGPRWQVGGLGKVLDVELIAGPKVLLVEKEETVSKTFVRERSLAGKVVWEWEPAEGLFVRRCRCRRLPNGNTWLSSLLGIQEVTADRVPCPARSFPEGFLASDYSGTGQIAALVSTPEGQNLWQLDPVNPGKDRRVASLGQKTVWGAVEWLPDGRFLLSGNSSGVVVEVDRHGQRVWQAWSERQGRATRLPNGHTLVSTNGRVEERDRQGRVVWEAVPGGAGQGVRSCLNLVRLGFPPAAEDIDRSLDYRVRTLQSKDVHRRRQAAQILGEMGPRRVEAMPALIAALADPDWRVRNSVARILGELGPKARPAVPALLTALNDPEGDYLFGYLAGIGPTLLPFLVKALREDPRPFVRGWAVTALGELEEEVSVPVAELKGALHDRDAFVRLQAVGVLSTLSRKQASLLPSLIEALHDHDPKVRQEAIVALHEAGPGADHALPVLLKLHGQGDSEMRCAVLLALGSVGQRHKAVLPLLLETMEGKDDRTIREAAVEAIGRMGAGGVAAVPRLTVLLRSLDVKTENDVGLSNCTIGTLGRLAPFDKKALAAVLEQLTITEGQADIFRLQAAVHAVEEIGPAAKAGLPALIQLLHNGPVNSRSTIAALRTIGPDAIPELVKRIQNEHSGEDFMEALGKFGPLAKPAVPALVEVLKTSKFPMNVLAAQTLGNIGPGAAGALPALLNAIHDKDANLSRDAAEALGKIGADNKEALVALLALAQDRNQSEYRRCGALWGLGHLGRSGRRAVPALVEALRTPYDSERREEYRARQMNPRWEGSPQWLDQAALDHYTPDLRACALIALWRLGPSAEDALSVLLELCADDRAEVFDRWVAIEAVARIGLDAGRGPQILRLLENDSTPLAIQVGVIRALAAMGPKARAALPALTRARSEGPRPVRLAAREAVERISR